MSKMKIAHKVSLNDFGDGGTVASKEALKILRKVRKESKITKENKRDFTTTTNSLGKKVRIGKIVVCKKQDTPQIKEKVIVCAKKEEKVNSLAGLLSKI